MTSFEDPVTTVVRLLSQNMHLMQDDGGLASVYCSKEWYDQELLKNYDAQVTVGLQRAEDQKLTLNAINRRRLSFLKVNGWSSNRDVRDRLREEINRIIREKRTVPNVTGYDFAGLGYPSGDPHKAYYGKSIFCLLPPTAPEWNELAAADYEKLWYSDDNRYSYSHDDSPKYAMMLFRFKIESREQTVKKIVLSFEGYGTTPTGNGIVIRAWNDASSSWDQSASGWAGEDEIITITLTSNLTNYIDENGYVLLLAETIYGAEGEGPATIYCDYVSCTVTVNGITYCDVVGFRDLDQVRVKPFLWRTEFIVKTWMFEKVLGG